MQPAVRKKIRALQALGKRPLPTWGRVVIVLALTILYILTFSALLETVGLAWAAFIAIPVGLTGWYFGPNSGLLAGLIGVALSTILLVQHEDSHWVTWIVTGWPGYLVVVACGYAAGLLRNASAERAEIRQALKSRERFLSIINITTKNVIAPKKAGEEYYLLISHLANLFVADYAFLTHVDHARERVTLIATTKTLDHPPTDIVLEPDEAAPTLSALQSGRTLIIDDIATSRCIVDPGPIKEFALSPRSALVIPLAAGAYQFGAAVVVYETPHHFTREETGYAELAGNQISLALWTAQQNIQLEQKLKETITLTKIEQVLSETERVGIENVLQIIVDSTKELIPKARYAVLHLLDEEQQVLIPSAVSGYKSRSGSKMNMRLGEGVAGQAIAARKIIYVPDTLKDPQFVEGTAPVKFRSLIVAPIQSQDRCVGAISIQSEQPNAFTPDESQLLGALGTQAAIAIENSTLLETTRRDLKEINALYRISQHLVASLDPDHLMKDVVDLLVQSFEYLHAQIFVADPASGTLVMRQGSGETGTRLKERGHRIPIGTGIVGHAAETREAFFTNNVESVVFFLRNPLLPNTQSELTVPIMIENTVLGVLDIQQAPPRRLAQRDMQLMKTVADQLAVALQKANLYADLQNALHQEQATRSQLIHSERLAAVGRLLASVSHELSNPMQAIQNALFLLKEEKGISDQGRQDLEIILSEAERMAVMLERLRTSYQPVRVEDFQPVEINEIIETVHALAATYLRHSAISFEFRPDPDLPAVPGLADQLRQVFLNLFMNAVDAMDTGGHLLVVTHLLAEHREVLIEVSDTGPGIDPALLPKLFEAFVTNKESGSGLGLSISHEIVSKHHGRIQAENNPQGGATFRVWLPTQHAPEEA